MKKFLFLTVLSGALLTTAAYAQGGDQAAMLQQIKERVKPQMVEKTGLTNEQADKVIEINFEMRQSMMQGVNELSAADRAKKIEDFKAARDRKYSEIPLTAEQIKAVKTFYEDMGKSMPPKGSK